MKLSIKIIYCLFIAGFVRVFYFTCPDTKSNIISAKEHSVLDLRSDTKTILTVSGRITNGYNSAGNFEKVNFSSDKSISTKFNSPLKRIKSNSFYSNQTGKNSPYLFSDLFLTKKSVQQYVNLSYLKFLRIAKMLC